MTIILSAGGTGGHIFPAHALAQRLKGLGFKVYLLTEERCLSFNHPKDYFERVYKITVSDFSKRGFFNKLIGILKTVVGFFQTVIIFFKIRPSVIVGFGGYSSFPPMLVALIFRFNFIIHEQNIIVGRVNRFFAKFCNKIAVSFPETKNSKNAIVTGLPVRSEFIKIRNVEYSFERNKDFNILVLGGSQGTKVFGRIIPESLKKIPKKLRENICIFQQCRKDNLKEVKRQYDLMDIKIELFIFLEDLPSLLKKAHLVISRAGASTIAELSVVGCPAIFIPYPWAKDNHQVENAKVIAKKGAAWIIYENELTIEKLKGHLVDIIKSPENLIVASECMRNIKLFDAKDSLLNIVKKMARNK